MYSVLLFLMKIELVLANKYKPMRSILGPYLTGQTWAEVAKLLRYRIFLPLCS